MKIVLVAAVALVDADGRVLISKRPEGKQLGGLWEFPGGKVESAESAAEAAVRECREETGLAVEVVSEYRVDEHDYAHDRVELHFFACRPLDPAAEPRSPFCWVARADLPKHEFPEGNRRLLALLADHKTA